MNSISYFLGDNAYGANYLKLIYQNAVISLLLLYIVIIFCISFIKMFNLHKKNINTTPYSGIRKISTYFLLIGGFLYLFGFVVLCGLYSGLIWQFGVDSNMVYKILFSDFINQRIYNHLEVRLLMLGFYLLLFGTILRCICYYLKKRY